LNFLKTILVIALTFNTYFSYAQYYNTEIEASITNSDVNQQVELKAFAKNKTQINTSLRYVFSIIYPDSAEELQKEVFDGRLVLIPEEKKEILAETRDFEEVEEVIVLFLIYDTEDKLVGKDRKVFRKGILVEEDQPAIAISKQKFNMDVETTKEDGLVLRGIVIEDTKTKPGSDFYKTFYSNYLSKNVNGSSIVTIKEVLAIGRNTKIEVLVGDTKVFEFFVRPSTEYLSKMAEISLMQVVRQLEMLFKNQNTVQRY